MVPLCDGGLQESEGRVSALHGWQTQTHTSTHFHTHIACVEGISVMTVRITFSIRLPGASYLAPSDTHTQRLLHRSSTSGELLVIIGKSFEGCQYSDGGDAGLLNMVCKTHPACQQSTCSPQLNDLVN